MVNDKKKSPSMNARLHDDGARRKEKKSRALNVLPML
jgi:hypothetical protein